MHALELTTDLAIFGSFPSAVGLLAYVGLGPGPEFIPYFMALLSFVGVALIAILQWPISIFLGYLSKVRRRQNDQSGANAIAAEPFKAPCDE